MATMLRYKDNIYHQEIRLAWHPHQKGAELRIHGSGFEPTGFSIGVYAAGQLQRVLDQFNNRTSRPKYSWQNWPLVYPAVYTFTRPVKYAKLQGAETRLAIHAEEYEDSRYSYNYFPRPTATIDEFDGRIPWRWLGRYPLVSVCAFLESGIEIAQLSQERTRK